MTDLNIYSKEQTDTLLGTKANASDVYTKAQVDTEVAGKQDTLVSGSNIKTINNVSLLGSGNINVNGMTKHTFSTFGEMATAIINHPCCLIFRNTSTPPLTYLDQYVYSLSAGNLNVYFWKYQVQNNILTEYFKGIHISEGDTNTSVTAYEGSIDFDISNKSIYYASIDQRTHNASEYEVYY